MRPARQLPSNPQLRASARDTSQETQAWSLLQALARAAARGEALCERVALAPSVGQGLQVSSESSAFVVVRPDLPCGWSSPQALDPSTRELLDLYMPLCVGPRSATLVVAHLGQSADGHTAALSSTNKFITGSADILHNHRLRALCDVVLVGASTVEIDDPLLTTRLVSGRSPVRVVVDPNRRLQRQYAVFRDRAARTIVAHVAGRAPAPALPSHVESMSVRRAGACMDLRDLLAQLRARGLSRVFIEGGAVTIAHFLRAGLLDRLQLAVAPLRLGPKPCPPSPAPGPGELAELCRRVRRFHLGEDVLFDGEL